MRLDKNGTYVSIQKTKDTVDEGTKLEDIKKGYLECNGEEYSNNAPIRPANYHKRYLTTTRQNYMNEIQERLSKKLNMYVGCIVDDSILEKIFGDAYNILSEGIIDEDFACSILEEIKRQLNRQTHGYYSDKIDTIYYKYYTLFKMKMSR